MKDVTKRKISILLSCIFVAFVVVLPFLTVILVGICLPAQYGETFYGELAPMFEKLRSTEGKKIVILGNSNVAFGVDSALAETLLRTSGEDYAVCNFGLYGALGTRMMCELAADFINEGDFVIFSPEPYAQSFSAYFSAEEAWYALDSDFGMYGHLSEESRDRLAGGYFSYTAKKLSQYRSGRCAEGSGVYARSSFDENGDLKNYPRPNNVMEGGADLNTPIVFDQNLFAKDFLDFINGYAESMQKKGARFCYSFAPMNTSAMPQEAANSASAIYDLIDETFDFEVMSDPEDYMLDSAWFYDSNFHLNEAGMTVRTVQLVNDIKNQLGNTTKTEYPLPEKPVIPDPEIEGEGDNRDAGMFEYRLDGNTYTLIGLTEEGKKATELVIPYQVNGIYVRAFSPEVFAEDGNLKQITVQENIRTLQNGSFSGCNALERIVLRHSDPADISVGYELLAGTPSNCKIFVPNAALSKFENNYFWGKYAKQLQGY